MGTVIENGTAVCPGTRLARASEVSSGTGTYVRGRWIHAMCLGSVRIDTAAGTIQVERSGDRSPVPQIGDVVTAQVVSVTVKLARVTIICVGLQPLKNTTFRGIIRLQDVREHEKDKVEMSGSFRPGDVVRAKVLSLGDSRSYFLTTAENTLGVVAATSALGAPMVPVSWCEMRCKSSGVRERRKVAKVVE